MLEIWNYSTNTCDQHSVIRSLDKKLDLGIGIKEIVL